MATWWIKWENLNWPNPDNLDKIRRRADALADGNVTTVVDFGTHFRWDYLPYFEILHDYLATVTEECHKRGMEFIDHHSINLIHRYSNREEMRYVMIHSGPHLPFSPSYQTAASWEYHGHKLNDWRCIDVETGKPLYYPIYQSEGFCHRNPEFIEAYIDYAKKLVTDTGIDGLMADDSVYYMHYRACGCKYCREELQRRASIDLPPVGDTGFWGNFDNPAWRAWIDLRFDACGEFQEKLQAVMPEGFLLMSCGSRSSAGSCVSKASDARQFLRGCNYTNLELSGNTPPYKKDPVTVNDPIESAIINGSHHQGAGREKGVRCFGTGYGFSKPTANIIWAVNKVTGADCWFSTLKSRLGLPDHILDSLPEEGELIKDAFTFEKKHQELFEGDIIPEVAVYFSYEARNHTLFGTKYSGFEADYSSALKVLCKEKISVHTIFSFPDNAEEYPLVIYPSPVSVTESEMKKLDKYLAAGGKVIITGPSAVPGCKNNWIIPNRLNEPDPSKFFHYTRDRVWIVQSPWMYEKIEPSTDENIWTEVKPGMFYNPLRISDGKVADGMMGLCRKFIKPQTIILEESEGYFSTVFDNNAGTVMHLLAEDYDTDIDHRLDEIRFHRSRVNLVIKADPIGTSRIIKVSSGTVPQVYTPFNREESSVISEGNLQTITLPENCAYAILLFPGTRQ